MTRRLHLAPAELSLGAATAAPRRGSVNSARSHPYGRCSRPGVTDVVLVSCRYYRERAAITRCGNLTLSWRSRGKYPPQRFACDPAYSLSNGSLGLPVWCKCAVFYARDRQVVGAALRASGPTKEHELGRLAASGPAPTARRWRSQFRSSGLSSTARAAVITSP